MIELKYVPPFILIQFYQGIPNDFNTFLASTASYNFKEFNYFTGMVNVNKRFLFKYINDTTVCVPKGFLPRILDYLNKKQLHYVNNIPKPNNLTRDWSYVDQKYKLRPMQKDCLLAVDNAIQAGYGGVVVAPPAYGKSFLMSALCSLYNKAKIDVVSHRRDVVRGNYSTIKSNIGRAGLVTSGKKEFDRVTAYTAGSLQYSNFDADLVLLDEVHELVTDRYYEKINRYENAICVGFTATVDTRFDNLHKRIEALCGPVLYQIEYKETENAGLVVPILVQWFDTDFDVNPIENITNPIEAKKYGIWYNQFRNQCIADAASFFYEDGYQVLILVETIEHALLLKQLLPEFEVCYANSAKEGKFPEDLGFKPISNARRDELKNKFLNREIMGVIATGIWSVGVSFDSLEVLCRADGTASKTAATQYPGRVCRISKDTGKQYGIVLDFTDGFDKRTKKRAVTRQKIYAKNDWEQYDPHGNRI